jgi:hypothetical protein
MRILRRLALMSEVIGFGSESRHRRQGQWRLFAASG